MTRRCPRSQHRTVDEVSNPTKVFASSFILLREKHREALDAIASQSRIVLDPFHEPGRQIQAAFNAQGWNLGTDEYGNITRAACDQDDLRGLLLFQAVAPFVAAGSYVEFWQAYANTASDRPNTRWDFDGKGLRWTSLVTLEQKAEQRTTQAALEKRDHSAAKRIYAESLVRMDIGEPPLCWNCAAEHRVPNPMAHRDIPTPSNAPFMTLHGFVCETCQMTFTPPREEARYAEEVRIRHRS